MDALSLAELLAAMPALPRERGEMYIGALNRSMERWGIVTFARRCHFLGQLRHESTSLTAWKEKAPPDGGWHYDPSRNPRLASALGNTRAGDGPLYIGRGPLQLTGRANYREAGIAIGYALEEQPELLETVEPGLQSAGWFWASRRLNFLADQDDDQSAQAFSDAVMAITRKINGGLTGLSERMVAVVDAKIALRPPDFSDVTGGSSTV